MDGRNDHLAQTSPHGEGPTTAELLRLAPDRAVVVVIDAQHDFCSPGGLQSRQGRDVERLRAPLARLEHFLPAARRAGVPVVFVRNLHGDGTDEPNWLARHTTARDQSCQVGTWGAEFAGTGPIAGDHVVDKHRYSAFAGTRLLEQLRELRRDALLFTGFTTNVCVESSLREAVCRDLLATLVEDCCGAYDDAAHERAVDSVRAGFGVVSTSTRVLDVWRRLGAVEGSEPDPEAVSA